MLNKTIVVISGGGLCRDSCSVKWTSFVETGVGCLVVGGGAEGRTAIIALCTAYGEDSPGRLNCGVYNILSNKLHNECLQQLNSCCPEKPRVFQVKDDRKAKDKRTRVVAVTQGG